MPNSNMYPALAKHRSSDTDLATMVTLYNETDFVVTTGYNTIHLKDLRLGETVDEWYTLTANQQPLRGDVGCLRSASRYLHEIIMPLKEYTSLKEVRRFS